MAGGQCWPVRRHCSGVMGHDAGNDGSAQINIHAAWDSSQLGTLSHLQGELCPRQAAVSCVSGDNAPVCVADGSRIM
jgi:hypothetical protein